MSQQSASSPNGNMKMSVVAVNQLDGDRMVTVTITENNVADLTNVVLLPDQIDGLIRANAAAPTANTTVSSDNFTRSLLAEYFAYLAYNRFSMKDIRISTSDVENLKGALIYQKSQMDGQNEFVKKDLRGLRVNVGNGYSDSVDIPNWVVIKDEKSKLMISKLKRNTSVTIQFTIDGVADAANFVSVGSSSIR